MGRMSAVYPPEDDQQPSHRDFVRSQRERTQSVFAVRTREGDERSIIDRVIDRIIGDTDE